MTQPTHSRQIGEWVPESAGFSLLEIMAVVVIMSLLVGLVGINVLGRIDDARVSTARTQMKLIETALEFYKMDNGRYPSDDQGLEALIRKPTSGADARNYRPEGYLKNEAALTDPWGEPYYYEIPGQHNPYSFDLWSHGSDASPGGEGVDADFGNWSERSIKEG